MRLNQAVAKTGYCSRRRADQLIAAGAVRVNGVTAQDYNLLVDPSQDKLSVNGKELAIADRVYVAVNKPKGIVTTCADEKGRRSVTDLLPRELRFLRPVGRLDMNSEGLLMFTNDGELTQRLTHPSQHEIKRYEVTVEGHVSRAALDKLRSGVELEDGVTLPAQVAIVRKGEGRTLLKMCLAEGRNRQIRRMCKQLGYPVRKLTRTSVGALELGGLPPGSWRYLEPHELRKLGVKL